MEIPLLFRPAIHLGGERIRYSSSHKLVLPKDHPLCPAIKGIQLLEFKSRDSFERQLALIEDHEGNRISVLLCRDKFNPANRDEKYCPYAVYGTSSTVGSIDIVQTQSDTPFTEANKIATAEAKKMRFGCIMSGVTSDENIQLSGMSAVVFSDQKKPDMIDNIHMQQAVAYLFCPAGPFNCLVVPPSGSNAAEHHIYDSITNHGGKVVTCGADESISVERYNKMRATIFDMIQKKFKSFTGDETILGYATKSFLANIPLYIHLHELESTSTEPLSPGPLLEYIESNLIKRLDTRIDQLFPHIE